MGLLLLSALSQGFPSHRKGSPPAFLILPTLIEEARFLMGVAEIELPFPQATNIHRTEFLPRARQAKNPGPWSLSPQLTRRAGNFWESQAKKTGGFVLDH